MGLRLLAGSLGILVGKWVVLGWEISFNWNLAVTSSDGEGSGMWYGGQTGEPCFLRMKERLEEKKLFFLPFFVIRQRWRRGDGVTGMNLGYKRNFCIVCGLVLLLIVQIV